MWKKSVLEWRQEHPTQSLTLDQMAPLLKNALDKFSPNGDAVRHGFRVCGLYPWDPNPVDYSKCLGAMTKKSVRNCNNRPSGTATVSFETYHKIIGEELLNEVEPFSPDLGTCDNKCKEFIILH